MKLLVFGDTHTQANLTHLQKPAKDADLLLHAGDFSEFGRGLRQSLDTLNTLAQQAGKKLIIIHGNHDGRNVGEHIKEYAHLHYIHADMYVHEDIVIIGYGGGGFSHEDPALERIMHEIQKQPDLRGKRQVWLFHGPPYDMEVDVIPGWGATGCRTRRKLIEEYKPQLVIVGHIHEGFGKTYQTTHTVVLNPGPTGLLVEF